jgi:hypothetical protein
MKRKWPTAGEVARDIKPIYENGNLVEIEYAGNKMTSTIPGIIRRALEGCR